MLGRKAEYEPMREGDEVLIDFDEDDFDESEDFFSVEGEEQDDEDDEAYDESRSVKRTDTRSPLTLNSASPPLSVHTPWNKVCTLFPAADKSSRNLFWTSFHPSPFPSNVLLSRNNSEPVQVIGVEEAMERVLELKKLGPPVPVKGERARSKRRVPVVAVIGERGTIIFREEN